MGVGQMGMEGRFSMKSGRLSTISAGAAQWTTTSPGEKRFPLQWLGFACHLEGARSRGGRQLALVRGSGTTDAATD